jgi:hypothetical protein
MAVIGDLRECGHDKNTLSLARVKQKPSTLLVSQEIRDVAEPGIEKRANVAGDTTFVHGACHARQPLIALDFADGEGHVSPAQARMAVLFNIALRTAEPATEEFVEFLPSIGQFGLMQCPYVCELRIAMHEIVKRIHQRAHRSVAAKRIKRRMLGAERKIRPHI